MTASRPSEPNRGDQPVLLSPQVTPSEDLTRAARYFSFTGPSSFDGEPAFEGVFDALARALHRREPPPHPATARGRHALLDVSEAELRRADVAELNLLCSAGLPGAERVDPGACLRALDEWADIVRRWTDAAFHQHFLPAPGAYDNSEVAFRLVSLHTALHRHCGVRYHPAKVGARPDDPFDLDDMCIASVARGEGGTCATLPVVYAAVGRRLGYPMRLALARSHVFCRWDDPTTGLRVNLDGGSTPNVHPDEYYRRWPAPMTAREEGHFGYLRSLTRREELAHFVGSRGWVWESLGDYLRAVDEFAAAAELDEPSPRWPSAIRRTVGQWRERLGEGGRQAPRVLMPGTPRGPRRWPGMPWELEAEVLGLAAAEQLTRDRDMGS